MGARRTCARVAVVIVVQPERLHAAERSAANWKALAYLLGIACIALVCANAMLLHYVGQDQARIQQALGR